MVRASTVMLNTTYRQVRKKLWRPGFCPRKSGRYLNYPSPGMCNDLNHCVFSGSRTGAIFLPSPACSGFQGRIFFPCLRGGRPAAGSGIRDRDVMVNAVLLGLLTLRCCISLPMGLRSKYRVLFLIIREQSYCQQAPR